MITFRKIGLPAFLLFIACSMAAQVRQGDAAPEIALPGINGDTIRLSSLKGKVVLIDFWAAWCGPCRAANKQMVKLYPKYKERGFEILGVSLDDSKNAWIKAVKKDKITWLQVIDNGGWQAKTARRWNIYQLPTSYLVDKDGTLIAMDPEPKELEKMLNLLLE